VASGIRRLWRSGRLVFATAATNSIAKVSISDRGTIRKASPDRTADPALRFRLQAYG
jgi:hypothetical protein